MNDIDVHEFINHYRIKDIHPVRDRDSYQTFEYGRGHTASYHTDHEQMIEMEMPRRAFEELVDNDKRYETLCHSHREEAWMRREHPAINEAYSKYIMLLELYK